MPAVLPDVMNASLAADKKQTVSRLYLPASFTRLEGLLQTTDGELSLNLSFRGDRNNRILLSGNISGQITAQCQRCLGPAQWQLDLPLELILVEQNGSDIEAVAGKETYRCDPMNLELGSMIEEEILLGMPLVVMHEDGNEDCQRINEHSVAGDVYQPFADLKDLGRSG